MKDFNLIIGKNLGNIRKQKNLSLDKVSELTGVSKAMLAQIEKGSSNPTVTTLWKIASGLNVSFSFFMEDEEKDILYLSHSNISPIFEEEEKMKVYPLFSFDNKRSFEIFTIELEQGCEHKSSPHNDGVEEYVIVTEGEMNLLIEDNQYVLKRGDAIRYLSNKTHSYWNNSHNKITFINIIYYLI